jgi:MinD-like ATPase involved in chromosome partitioning or flagellar assembly/CheY-like chemotaxis protein
MSSAEAVLIASRDAVCLDLAEVLAKQGIRTAVTTSRDDAEVLLADPEIRWVAVVDGDLPAYDGVQLCRLLQDEHGIPTLLLAPPDLTFHRSAYTDEAPNREFALKPLSLSELVMRVKAMMLRGGFTLVESTPHRLIDTAAAESPAIGGLASANANQIVAVFSLKGGSGKSTIAVNTAVALSVLREKKVILVDADLWMGDVAVLMNVAGDLSAADLCLREMTEIELLKQILVHHPSGVDVLQRPPELGINEQLNREPLVKALPIYRTVYDFVIVNMNSSLDEMNLQILDVADVILLVTTPEVTAITNTARFLEVARRVGYDRKLRVILNRANSGINLATIEETLDCKVTCRLVSDGRSAVGSANEGIPLLIGDPEARLPLTQGVVSIVDELAGIDHRKAIVPNRNMLSFIRKLAG